MAWRQGEGCGLCGVYAVINALDLLFPMAVTRANVGDLFRHLVGSLPDAREALQNGLERPGLEIMLGAAREWSHERGMTGWTWWTAHPSEGETAATFWRTLARELATVRTTAVLGMGDGPDGDTRFEPHWTVVERITRRTVELRDSCDYKRFRMSETGIKPEPGWQIEDLFIVRRSI